MTNSSRPIWHFGFSLSEKTDHERSLNLRKPNGEFLNNRNTNWNKINSTHLKHIVEANKFSHPISICTKSFVMDRVQVYTHTHIHKHTYTTHKHSLRDI